MLSVIAGIQQWIDSNFHKGGQKCCPIFQFKFVKIVGPFLTTWNGGIESPNTTVWGPINNPILTLWLRNGRNPFSHLVDRTQWVFLEMWVFSVYLNSSSKQVIVFGTLCRDKTKMKTAILSIAVFITVLAYGSHCHAASVATPPTKTAVSVIW